MSVLDDMKEVEGRQMFADRPTIAKALEYVMSISNEQERLIAATATMIMLNTCIELLDDEERAGGDNIALIKALKEASGTVMRKCNCAEAECAICAVLYDPYVAARALLASKAVIDEKAEGNDGHPG